MAPTKDQPAAAVVPKRRGHRRSAAKVSANTVEIAIPAALDRVAVERALRAHVEDLARVAKIRDAVQEAHAPLPPGLLAAVADQENRWRDIDRRYGLYSSADVAALVGSTARNRSEYASNLRSKGQVLAVARRGRYVYPAFQFSAAGRVHQVVPAVLAVLRDQDWDPESIILWMTAPNGYLGGDAPADRIDDTDAVLDAATNAAHAGR